MDFSKAFDTLNHKRLIAKLHVYSFNRDLLKLIPDFLSNKWQRTKIIASFSSWAELTQGISQGSVMSPLLFNIYLNDLFYLLESTEFFNFANDPIFFACDKDLKTLIRRLKHNSHLAIKWFISFRIWTWKLLSTNRWGKHLGEFKTKTIRGCNR